MASKLTLGVTGHRLHLLPGYTGETSSTLRQLLVELAIEKLEEWHPDLVITGMATGWDMAVGMAAMLLNIPYRAYVPFVGQEKPWGAADKSAYHSILEEAEEVRVISPVHSAGAYHARDRAMVDDSDRMLALLLPGMPNSGTAQTVEYAEGWLVPWSNVAEEFLERLQRKTAQRP